MLKIMLPNFCVPEIEYTCSVVFTEWLGIDYEIITVEQNTILISSGDNTLQLSANFFTKASNNWLNKESMPVLPLKKYTIDELKVIVKNDIHIDEAVIPVLYGIPEITVSENTIDCSIDILGSIFFMISRYEEIVIKERDDHNRFSVKSSVAYKEDFLFRPIVNEYLELLFALLKHLFPQLQRKTMQFKLCPTHDVDVPFAYLNIPVFKIIKQMGGDILKRKSTSLALKTYFDWIKFKHEGVKSDPYYSFDFIMDQSEKRNVKSTFYFLPSSSPEMPKQYPVSLPEMQSLLQSIDRRGHEIGIHGFYGTYLNNKAFTDDVQLLQDTLVAIGIGQEIKGGRQHYLQWQNPETFVIWENAGVKYDSTLSFADMPGFRCGTCYEYSVYDCITRRKLKLKERPLIAMECSIIAERYMNLGLTDDALQVFENLKAKCKYYNGNFVLLFHNTEFLTEAQKQFYIEVLDC